LYSRVWNARIATIENSHEDGERISTGHCPTSESWFIKKVGVAANDGKHQHPAGAQSDTVHLHRHQQGMMTPDDLIVCDLGGNKLEGSRERTTEIAMHLTIYQMRPDILSVVHAHPPVATGFAVAGRGLTQALLPEVVIGWDAFRWPSTVCRNTPRSPKACCRTSRSTTRY